MDSKTSSSALPSFIICGPSPAANRSLQQRFCSRGFGTTAAIPVLIRTPSEVKGLSPQERARCFIFYLAIPLTELERKEVSEAFASHQGEPQAEGQMLEATSHYDVKITTADFLPPSSDNRKVISSATKSGPTRIMICGRGGSGKDFLRKKLAGKGMPFQVSYTTRPPREGEVDGVDYHFITAAEFDKMTERKEWCECVHFNGWGYGSTKSQFLTNGSIFIQTPTGLAQMSPEDRQSSFIIYLDVAAPVIKERLAARSNMVGDTITRRMKADEEQFSAFVDYDLRIANSDF